MKCEIKKKIPLTILFVIINFSTVLSTLLDYTLYSQILKELDDPNAHSNSVYNYFKLNNSTLNEYNDYLFFSKSERLRLKQEAKNMFQFAYDNYMQHAYPLDELDPIHCRGRGPDHAHPDNININDSLGGYMLTLVESLSTLIVMGNSSEFKRAARLVIDNLDFDKENTVQVFESNIRYAWFLEF